jgi:hypothetical protein
MQVGQQTAAPAQTEQEVTTVEIFTTSTTFPKAQSLVALNALLTGAGQWAAQGTALSAAAYRGRTRVAPMTTVLGSALLPISDVVGTEVFGGLAGIRSWSPPV